MRFRIAFLTGVLALCAVLAAATTVQPMSVERLTEASAVVVQAQALESWSQWEEDGGLIYTYTRFRVQDRLKGAAPQEIVVKQMGGEAEGYRQYVAGVQPWREGEEAVLFLRPSRETRNAMVVTGLMQGDFRVRRMGSRTEVSNGVPDVEMFDGQTRTMVKYSGTRMSLEELQSRVRRVVTR